MLLLNLSLEHAQDNLQNFIGRKTLFWMHPLLAKNIQEVSELHIDVL
jgi:hypothetical protein